MNRQHHRVLLLFLSFVCLTAANVFASPADPYGLPLTEKEIASYEKISFTLGA